MSAPTPAPGDESPHEGYYPDPSIPGYVRYWNGASWVPGTSRPAPRQGESMPAEPSGAEPSEPAAEPRPEPHPPGRPPSRPAAPAPVDETGPVFLDEAPSAGNRPEPATAWQADASRQTGFGGERDRRVSWGGTGQSDDRGGRSGQGDQGRPSGTEPGPDPRTPAVAPADHAPADRAPADPRQPAAAPPENTVAIRLGRQGRPGSGGGDGTGDAGRPPVDGTVTIRAVGQGGGLPAHRAPEPAASEGTMAIRAIAPGTGAQNPAPAPAQNQAPAPAPDPVQNPAPWAQLAAQQQQPQLPAQQQPQPPAQQQGPRPQLQQHQLQPQRPQPPQPLGVQGAQPDQPVVPWKPPVDDPFQQLVQAQAAARPAGLAKRFAARLIDTVVLMALVGAIGFPLVSQALDHIDEKIDAAKLSGETVTVWLVDSTTAGLFGGVLGAFLVLGVLLEALPTAKWGRTLGKKVCGLDVRDIESHDAPSFGAALRRWLVYGVLGVLVIGVVNVVWCLIDRPWRQCWHDKVAHTFVAG
ncbi:RDD family protein [Streptomyces sp. JV185]|uniref:RDD family protein n=1 Tax=Streptomyces sp. JV185 TaxID=858638 RepID=UPI002E7662CB|nr:RDD family protein [Streptomyces sp. JV185]MEE1771567.1 RDD family protein [Streptomyces sp. JV185]